MLSWYSMESAQMANNLIKWWRTKFLNGYKQFSVGSNDYGNGRMSDTEELLGHIGGGGSSMCNSSVGFKESSIPTCSTPPLCATSVQPPSQQPSNIEKTDLKFEEFSCDVSMEGEVDEDGQERQEFSFTLYDFDCKGKITKDDIAGLVTTIYETLGSSIKVSQHGSKTIKVKLTVSPNETKPTTVSATVIDYKSSDNKTSSNKQKDNNISVKQNINLNNKLNSNKHMEQCEKLNSVSSCNEKCFCCNLVYRNNNEAFEVSDAEDSCNTDHCSRVSYDEISEDEGDCSDENEIPKIPSCEKIKERSHYQKHSRSPRYHHMGMGMGINNQSGIQNAHVSISPVLFTPRRPRRSKKRSSSLQRQELLEIIQANMDKNKLSFQTTSRKQCPNHITSDLRHSSPTNGKQRRHKHKASQESAIQLQCLANMMNSNNYYVDLSSLQHVQTSNMSKMNQTTHNNLPYLPYYDQLLGAVMCMSNKNNVGTGLFQRSAFCVLPNSRNRRHISYRSKSHDVPIRYHLLETQKHISTKHSSPKSVKKAQVRSNKSYEGEFEQSPAAFKKNVKKFPQVMLGNSHSYHHLKHRNRQEDQARAMARVVRWLEQEFSSNVNVKSKSDNKSADTKSKSRGPSGKQASPDLGSAGVERHEHHHVHEHIHHHYHHYQEKMPVVV